MRCPKGHPSSSSVHNDPRHVHHCAAVPHVTRRRPNTSRRVVRPEYKLTVHACQTITSDTECLERYDAAHELPTSTFSGLLQPNNDLRLLCSKQLETIYEILRRTSTASAANSIRSTVYVRSPDLTPSSDLTLRKVVSLLPEQQPAIIPHEFPYPEEDDTLVLAAPDGQISVEEYLLQQTNLALPNSPTVVLPLAAHNPTLLVGLLVLERHIPPTGARPWNQGGHDSGSSVFTEEEVWLFGTLVPSLAQSCLMTLRSAVQEAQRAAKQQHASALVHGARGSLTAIRTFGSMLLPRLHEGEPDRDLASNMVVQSKQLEEVVQQLEAALRPDPVATPLFPPADRIPTIDPISPMGQDYPPFFPFSTTPRDFRDTRVPSDLLDCTPQSPPFSSPASPSSTLNPTSVDLASAPSLTTTTSEPTLAPPARALSPSRPESLTVHRDTGHPSSTPSSSNGCLALLPPAHSASNGVISMDLDVDQITSPSNPRPPPIAAAPPRTTTHLSASASASGHDPSAADECNLSDALVNVLTAAYKMCKVRGIQTIVCHPLRVHGRSSAASPATPGDGAAAAAAAVTAAAADLPQLLPRPVRPLRAAVPAALVAQAVSYVLEVVLASCTPGGLVGVYAQRTESPPWGIQLIVLFTGTVRMVTDALAAEWHLALGAGVPGGWSRAPAGESSLELAQGLLQQAGGRISITYPCKLKSKRQHTVEAGTCVEVWLPAVRQRPEPQQ